MFGAGLALSGMTDPRKILGFLDLAGDWDPSLLFVLGGAVGVTLITFRFILKRKTPLLDDHFIIKSGMKVDSALLIGSAIFGIGWGIGGLCPGPAIAMMASANREFWIFFPWLITGFLVHRLVFRSKAEIAEVNVSG